MPSKVDPATGSPLGVDLSSCVGVERLYVVLGRQLLTDKLTQELLGAVIDKWSPNVPNPVLAAKVYHEFELTRHEFIGILGVLGLITENWLESVRGVPRTATAPDPFRTQQTLCITILDTEEWREWWWRNLEVCFPTWCRNRELQMDYRIRE